MTVDAEPPARPRRPRKVVDLRAPSGDWRDGLVYRGNRVEPVLANAVTTFAHDPAWEGVLAWDVFSQCLRLRRPAPWFEDDRPSSPHVADAELTDSDALRAMAWLQRRYQLRIGLDAVWGALRVVAERRTIHPPRDYLEGLEWDGVRRLPTWLPTYLGGEQSTYAELVGTWFLVGAVARIYRPGCKLDTMLILEGAQGALKSSALRALFTPWFSDTPIDLESKDRFGAVRGKWGVELAELDSFRRTDANRIKSFLSSPQDWFRPAYGRTEVSVPRSCVVLGSTNADEYLTDPTGGRRFWPWRCGRIDLVALERDRGLLWAEARAAFEGGARWWATGEENAATLTPQQRERETVDPWQAHLTTWLTSKLPGVAVTVSDALTYIGVERARWTPGDAQRAGRCLARAGWTRVLRRDGDRREWVYVEGTTSRGTHKD